MPRARNAFVLVAAAGVSQGLQPTANSAQARLDFFSTWLERKQDELCLALEALDGSGARFTHDAWSRQDGSRGVSRVLQGGDIVEKGGVMTTFAKGILPEQRAAAMTARGRKVGPGQAYHAAALSIVLHAKSPLVPTFRSDVRLFVVGKEGWYGGGSDLTPTYLFEDDARDWHLHWKLVCDRHSADLYARLKPWCDEYFYLPLRREHRGIGGIFFDDLDSTQLANPEAFVLDVVDNFVPSWSTIVARRRDMEYSEDQIRWQRLRRGRYVEFNLLNDRGVKFGLTADAIERVLVSAPPLVAWEYQSSEPAADSAEGRLLAVLRQPRDWVPLRESSDGRL